MTQEDNIARAAQALSCATHLFIGAGAGLGVDSGLPDFRGNQGFWKAYPPLRHLNLSFSDMANPRWFHEDPTLAWGFYGHRLHLYRDTIPHQGFDIMHEWAQTRDTFVFTSNVDGQFQKAGFDPSSISEVHGSIHHLQCTEPCSYDIWDAQGTNVDVHPETFRAQGAMPTCPHCGRLARPNILMFGDGAWNHERAEQQHTREEAFYQRASQGTLVCLELGAGKAIPTIRSASQRIAKVYGGTHIRINPRDAEGPDGTLSLAMGAKDALLAIHNAMLHI